MSILFLDSIRCPECKTTQPAIVSRRPGHPWPTYLHQCDHCSYLITESEWDSILNTTTPTEGDSDAVRTPV